MPQKVQFLQLKISLQGANPPIWRSVIVPDNLTLHQLHEVIVAAMGWTNSHLHQFEMNDEFFGDPEDDIFEYGGIKDEQQYCLADLLTKEKNKIHYEYDFDDSWGHIVLLEKIVPTASQYPVCIKGERACPPEDVGGMGGYDEFLTVFADAKHPDYTSTRDWVGSEFDPDTFDMDSVNTALARLAFFRA